MESFGLIRTNPYLTTNVKVVYSNNKLYFESYDSSGSLGDNRYKRVIIPEDSYYFEQLAKYWKLTPTNIAFDSKNDEDHHIMYFDYQDQIDDTYLMGAKNVEDTDYPEEFEYVAPLHVEPNNLPEDFVIFRVDDPGVITIDSSNFRSEILNNMKVIRRYDLRPETKIGTFLDNSFNQVGLPNTAIDISFDKDEFTYWNGSDYNTGELTQKSKIMTHEFIREMTFSQGQDILTSGYKDNELIYPYIINLKFLFDDTPANENELKKWSINRYYGFYGKLEKIDKITPYRPPTLKSRLKLNSFNIFTLNGIPVDPFERGYKLDRTYYVEYQSEFYLVERIDEDIYKVISDIDLPQDVDTNLNLNTISFGEENSISLISGETFDINSDADMIFVEIEGDFHRLFYDGESWKILSDYTFTVNNNILRYYIFKSNPDYNKVVNLNVIDRNNPPKSFKVYQLNFSEVKDFDLNILDTDFSKHEYEFEEDIIDTSEPKLFEDDIKFSGTPKPVQRYIYKNSIVSIPSANEYLATGELYEVIENNTFPNKIWNKNPELVKWGVKGSLSNNDYPYMFNISKKGDDYNRTTNVEELIPDRSSRNLDYFYTFATGSYNFEFSKEVIHQSLSIINSEFDVSKYFNDGYTTSYFDEVFCRNETYNSETYPIAKYSTFLKGDQVEPNQTIFKGIKFSAWEIDSILTSISDGSKSIESLNVKGTDKYKDYKLSIILAELNKDPDSDFSTISNTSDWKMLKGWSKGETYYPNDIVIFDGTKFKNSEGQYGFPGYGTGSGTGSLTPEPYVYPDESIEELEIDGDFVLTQVLATGPNSGIIQLFRCSATTSITDPALTLEDDSNWASFPTSGYNVIWYQPNRAYTSWDAISASYSYLIEENGVNHNYTDHFSYYKEEYWKCLIDQSAGDNITPEFVAIDETNGLQVEYWEKIQEFSTTKNYTGDEIVTLDQDLYYYNNTTQELSLIHTFKPIAKTPYNKFNSILFNENFYFDNVDGSSLDNGINIYVNKKWKNVVIQLYFNDNLVDSYDIKRDNLYVPELQQITANNFIETMNNIVLKNGFINNIKYYLIESDDSYITYDISNIEDIPLIIQLEGPSELEFYSNSLNKRGVPINKSIINPRQVLKNNKLNDDTEIDHYNGDPIAIEFSRPDIFTYEDKTDIVFRFNGGYNPIFQNITLFNNENNSRYIFNENLKDFAEVREMIKSKVNDKENLLKIKDDSYKSIYPQVDEIGYFIDNHNMFKSTWDLKFYKKTERNL